MISSRILVVSICLICLVALGVVGLVAHGGAKGVVKERMDAMKAVGAATKALATMAKGDVAFSRDGVGEASRTIAGHAGEIDRLFPDTEESRNDSLSEAAPAIWENRSEFLALAKKLAETAAGLETVSTRAELGGHMKALVDGCKACHKKFRLQKH